MTEIQSTRWVYTSALEKYHKIECELEEEHHKVEKLTLVTQNAVDHLKSMFVKVVTFGQREPEFGRNVIPIHLDGFDPKEINQAVEIAGGVDRFLKVLERSIFTPATEGGEIPINDHVIELRVRACVDSLIVKAINAKTEKALAEKTLAKDRVALGDKLPEAQAVSDVAAGIMDKKSKMQLDIDES